MYKPPENTNRVKAIKSKFENNGVKNEDGEKLQSVRNNNQQGGLSRRKRLEDDRLLESKDKENSARDAERLLKEKRGLLKSSEFSKSNKKQECSEKHELMKGGDSLRNRGNQDFPKSDKKQELFKTNKKQESVKCGEKQELLKTSEKLEQLRNRGNQDSLKGNKKQEEKNSELKGIESEKAEFSKTNSVRQQLLSRQLSDPIKVNIKRSPAFRNDKQFQRNGGQISCRIKGTETKSPGGKRSPSPHKFVTNSTSFHFLSGKRSPSPQKSASNFSNLRKRFDSQEDLSVSNKHLQQHALRERSNTSVEIILNKKKMCNKVNDNNKKCFDSEENLDDGSLKIVDVLKIKEDVRYENISFLYSEPVPKALRRKENDVHNVSTLKISDLQNLKNGLKCAQTLKNAHNAKNNSLKTKTNNSGEVKFTGIDDELNYKLNALTDTLKLALKKPLPAGPAPKKPPRTFTHTSPNLQTKSDFEKRLNQTLQKSLGEKTKKSDPKYMLDKLENALKNNRIRLRKTPKIDYTSEEDNSNSETEKKPNNPLMNFNCLQSLSCSNATYERIGDSKSEFYTAEEPVYAEPFVFPRDNKEPDSKKSNRNSLYYMSTPVSATNGAVHPETMDENGLSHSDVGDETSSLSTPSTSDVDSVASTPSDENKKFMSSKIKELMKTFEPTTPAIDNRVDKLGAQLKNALDRSFLPSPTENTPPSAPSSTEGESKDARAGKYETYVKKIRMITKLRKKCDGSHLFYSCLMVGLDGKDPYIKFKFPPNVNLPANVEHLCFPDALDSSMDYSVKAQNYSIVLTDHLGKRIYGYCRRILPEDSQKCLPLAYCILSKQRAGRFYRRILEELESRHGMADKVRDIFLNELYYHQFPAPDQSVRFNMSEVNKHLTSVVSLGDRVESELERSNDSRISNGSDVDLTSFVLVNGTGTYGTLRTFEKEGYNKRNGVFFQNEIEPQATINDNEPTSLSTPTEFVITLHQDSRYKENDLEELCNTLKNDILQKVFASLLLERKVIFISSLLGKLSTCIEAVQNMLYPFQWPHTLISVVPKDLLEIVEAPTPLICGALSLNIEDYDIEHGIVVNLDKGKILKEVGDEDKIIPSCLLKVFKEGMSLAYKSSKENECAFNVLLSDAFIRIFINSCGHYKDYIKEKQFQKEDFIQHTKSKSVRRFLTWFTETTMFCSFVETVIANPSSFSVFDKRIQIYSSPDVNLILGKMKDWKKEKSNTLFF